MSVIGKGASSLRKKDVQEQKNIALGFKKIRFAHRATAGDTGINLTSLVQPTEMATNGFVNPSVADLGRAQISLFRNNLKLVSSLRGLLIDQLSYVVASSTQINFLDFTAEDGEIFTGWLDETPTTSLSVVDGKGIVATGELAAGNTDFNVGTPFEINKYPTQQVGAVIVYRNGLIQARCDGNNLSNTGDYIEVPVAGGLGSLIRFKNAPVGGPDAIMVLSNGIVAERPDGSMTAMIERVQGQIDQMVPTLAAVAGVPESTFQLAPNDIDLKQFGDTVLEYETRISKLETTSRYGFYAYHNASQSLADNAETVLKPQIVQKLNSDWFTYDSGTGIITTIKGGDFEVGFHFGLDMITAPIVSTPIAVRVYVNGVNAGEDFVYTSSAALVDYKLRIQFPLSLNNNDTIMFKVFQGTGAIQAILANKIQTGFWLKRADY